MMVSKRNRKFLLAGTVVAAVAFFGWRDTAEEVNYARMLRELDVESIQDLQFAVQGPPPSKRESPFNLPEWHTTWCLEPEQVQLPYKHCDHMGIFNRVPLYGGMTNALKMILLTAILSFETNQCFFVDEEGMDLLYRKDPRNRMTSILQRYFQPIGLDKSDPIVQRAIRENRVKLIDVRKDLFDDLYPRRIHGQRFSVRSLRMLNEEGHILKKIIMRRMWRTLPGLRNDTCRALDETFRLHDDYIGMSVRRGDKNSVEHRTIADAQDYITHAESVIRGDTFNNTAPKIFVATDDCAVMREFRDLKPEWEFLSMCDHQEGQDTGFALTDVQDWTPEQTDAHFKKFLIEIYALAISRYFIGWSFTNVSWWVYFMRPYRHSFYLVDKKENTMREVDKW